MKKYIKYEHMHNNCFFSLPILSRVRWLSGKGVRLVIRRLPVRFRPCKMTLCTWARHFTLLASGRMSRTYCKSLWIRASAKLLNLNPWLS